MSGNRILCLFLILFLLLSQFSAIAYGDDSSCPGPEFLLDKYHELEKEREKNPGLVPFYLASWL